MTSQNNRAPVLCFAKLCALFQSHQWIQTGVTVRKRPIRVKVDDFCPVPPWNFTDDIEKQQGTSSMPLQALCIISKPSVNSNWSYSPENWRMTWKTIRHLLCANSSFRYHSIAIVQFKLELQSGNSQFGSKTIFVPCDLEIWHTTRITIGHLFYATFSFVHHFIAIGGFKLEL